MKTRKYNVKMILFRLLFSMIGLLCFFLPRSAKAQVVRYENEEISKKLELINFVLDNDDRFLMVLHEKVKVDDIFYPQYHTKEEVDLKTYEKLKLLDFEVTMISPYSIMKSVANNYSWFGSHIQFAANTFSRAFMCFSFKNVLLTLEMIQAMDEQFVKDDIRKSSILEDKSVFRSALSSLTMLMATLATMHSELQDLADLVFEYVEITLSSQDCMFIDIRKFRKIINNKINCGCEEFDRNQFFKTLGLNDESKISYTEATPEEINIQFNTFINKLEAIYEGFNVKLMPITIWQQVLNYKFPSSLNVNMHLNIDNIE